MTTVRVLVADDHPVIRDGVRTRLERDGRAVVVAEAADTPTACHLAEQTRPDVALVDLRLASGGHGVDVIRYLHEHLPTVRILALSQAESAELAAHLIGALRQETRSLTAREREVLDCLAKGYDNREIADDLGITVRTVNRHLENIREKLGHRRRSALIRNHDV